MSIDPTAFAIDFDPKARRMSGVAIHGDTPFDVPFVSQIEGNLWTGGCANGLILPPEIEHVVSLYPWEQYTARHEIKSVLAVKLYDDLAGPDPVILLGLARWVNACRRDAPTLVHCQTGLNRSGLVAATALVLDGFTPAEAITLLRTNRSPAVLCNPTFERWLREELPRHDDLAA
jgi:hypothetical protein